MILGLTFLKQSNWHGVGTFKDPAHHWPFQNGVWFGEGKNALFSVLHLDWTIIKHVLWSVVFKLALQDPLLNVWVSDICADRVNRQEFERTWEENICTMKSLFGSLVYCLFLFVSDVYGTYRLNGFDPQQVTAQSYAQRRNNARPPLRTLDLSGRFSEKGVGPPYTFLFVCCVMIHTHCISFDCLAKYIFRQNWKALIEFNYLSNLIKISCQLLVVCPREI